MKEFNLRYFKYRSVGYKPVDASRMAADHEAWLFDFNRRHNVPQSPL